VVTRPRTADVQIPLQLVGVPVADRMESPLAKVTVFCVESEIARRAGGRSPVKRGPA